jgi:hypothetical protein
MGVPAVPVDWALWSSGFNGLGAGGRGCSGVGLGDRDFSGLSKRMIPRTAVHVQIGSRQICLSGCAEALLSEFGVGG